MNQSEIQRVLESAFRAQHDVLVRVPDYHDDFTKKFLPQLKTIAAGREVGCFPSLFPDFSVNTIVVYHTPTVRYIRLSPTRLQR